MNIQGGITNLVNSPLHKTNHMSTNTITWKFFSGRKAVASIGVIGAVGVILIVKFKKFIELGVLDQHLATPRFWVVPGLVNHGNNCFLNVVLQALASGSGLRKYLSEMVEEFGVEEVDDNLPLISSLTSLVEELCTVRHRRTVLSPQKLMLAMDLYIPNFNLTSQQDAEEAFSLLLSSLREEIAEQFVPDGAHLADLLSDSHSRIICPKSNKEESEAQRWRRNFLGPFDGVLGSVLLCERCSFQISQEFQVFHTLHLSPPISRDGTIMAGCTLEDCFKQFLMAEHIQNYCCSNCWHNGAIEYLSKFSEDKTGIDKLQNCSREDDPCNCKSVSSLETFPWSNSFCRASKQMSIAKCPKIFCIHLQRASYNVLGQSTKLQGHIYFPCTLDLSSFMNTRIVTKSSDTILRSAQLNRGSQDSTFFPQPNNQNMLLNATAVPSQHKKYRLISVVEHFGSGGGGHYVVYRRVMAKISDEDPASVLDSEMEQWFFISDSEVQSVSEKDVLSANATMLFYERINEP